MRLTWGPSPSFWVAAGALVCATVLALISLQGWYLTEFVVVFGVQLLIYGFAAWRLLTGKLHAPSRERQALILILVTAILLRGIALFSPQALSTDVFRYVWDGRVQAAGVNPYRYVPADPALAPLRDDSIYPNINRADYAHTIYPPTAQLSFFAIERIKDSVIGMKVGMLAFDGLTIACVVALLRSRGLPTTRVLLYAWHPLPIWEFAGTGHVDALAIALVMLAFVGASRRAPGWTGIALAAATLVKYYPLVVAPALYRRWDWRMPAAFVATVIVLYLPYLGVGRSVIGFLSGYASEEGLRSGQGIYLWSLLQCIVPLPGDALRYFAAFTAVVMLSLTAWILFAKKDAAHEAWADSLLLAGVFTLLVTPHDPWYFTWLVPFLCFRFSAAHLWLTAACVIMYLSPDPTGLAAQSVIYLPFLLLIAFQFVLKRRFIAPETFHASRPQSPTRA